MVKISLDQPLGQPEVFLADDNHLVKYLRQVLQLWEDEEKELEKKKKHEKEQEGRS